MLTYRAYRLDRAGKIKAGEWLAASGDEEAREKALALCEPGTPKIELWQGGRFIGRFLCEPRRRRNQHIDRGPEPGPGKPTPAPRD